MQYELRTYHCMPGRLGDVVRRFETVTLALWDKHGIRQAGFWTVVIGEDNHDLVYLLEWENLAERERRWGAFSADPEWLAARAKSEAGGPLVRTVSNAILAPTAFSRLR